MSFGIRLRQLREAYGITQEELGEKLNLTKANISKYESGRLEPNLDTLSFLAHLFGVSVDYLLGRPHSSSYNSNGLKKDTTKQAEDIIKIDPELFVQMCRATYLPEEDRKKIREYSAMLLEKYLKEEKEKGKKSNDTPK